MISAIWIAALLFLDNGDYYSDQYRYSVNSRSFEAFCTDQPPAPIRGFVASTQNASCGDLTSEGKFPSIVFWAEYNTVTQAKSAKALAESECGSPARKSRRGFANSKTYECVSIVNDITEVKLFAQSAGSDDFIDDRVNYRATIRYPGKQDEGIVRLARLISVDIVR